MNLRTAKSLTLVKLFNHVIRPQPTGRFDPKFYTYQKIYGFLLSRVNGKTKHRILILDQKTNDLTVVIVDWRNLEIVQTEDLNTLMTSEKPNERRLAELVYSEYGEDYVRL